MPRTIRNPVEYSAEKIGGAWDHLGSMTEAVRGQGADAMAAPPKIRKLTLADLSTAISRGYGDFLAYRTDVVFLCILYPFIGACLAWFSYYSNLLPLLFPLAAGFALIGPAAAVGLYEMSRRRERGETTDWLTAFGVMSSPSFGAILLLGLGLIGVFGVWIGVAEVIYLLTMGAGSAETTLGFLQAVIGTPGGIAMIAIGVPVGFVFAAAVLAISVVSFPMLLDRTVGVRRAVETSLRVAAANPVAVASWGLIVATGLVLGSVPVFLGLVVVLPVLGHATWHLYRVAVVERSNRP
ncbi:MAG: DUF2189 domain-containing protein [Pseudomonadota bacterium]